MHPLCSALCLLLVLLALPLGCGNDDGLPNGSGTPIDPPLPTPELVCPSYTAAPFPEMVPLPTVNASPTGAINGVFSTDSLGGARYSIPLTIPPARKSPSLGIVYNSHAPSSTLGKGFGIAGLSSIHRCGSNLAQDDHIQGVSLSNADHYCLDSARLRQIGTGSDAIGTFAEYRLWPDANIRVLGYGAPTADEFEVAYFVAYLPNGDKVHYGKSANARTVWRDAVTRSWHKELEVDRRGNTIRTTYASLGGGAHGTTQEHVINTMTYAGFIDDRNVETPGDSVIDFEYNDDPRYGTLFFQGDEISRRERLVRIDMRKNGLPVRSYSLHYEDEPATNEALLIRIDECAQGDLEQCKPATTFDWQRGAKGFSKHPVNVSVPTKSEDARFSWTIADVTGDGTADLWIMPPKPRRPRVERKRGFRNDDDIRS